MDKVLRVCKRDVACGRGRLGRCRGFCLALVWLGLVLGGRLSAQAPKRITEEGRNEVLWLDRLDDAANWHPVEECRTRSSTLACPWGGKAMELYFKMDFHGGEKAYPIGWPRAHINLVGWERNWRVWDRFEYMILVKSSRKKLPKRALILGYGETRPTYNMPLEFPELGKWVRISVPVAEVLEKSPRLKGGVPRLRFVVNESDYHDKDVVEFYVGGFRLVRSLACEVTAFSVATPVVYAGQDFVKLDLTVIGPPAEVQRGVPFTLRRGNRVIRREMLPLRRGRQVIECDISELTLKPGKYEMIVFEKDKTKRKSVALRVVEEPWQEK